MELLRKTRPSGDFNRMPARVDKVNATPACVICLFSECTFLNGLLKLKRKKNLYLPAGKRLWWSRGSVLAFGTQVRGFRPGRGRRIFQGEKILSTPSSGREVKPFTPYRRFTACKRSLNVTWKSDIFRQNSSASSCPFTTRVSGGDTWRCK